MADKWLLEDASGSWTLEDGSGYWILEEQPGSEVIIGGLQQITLGIVAQTAAGMGGVIQE